MKRQRQPRRAVARLATTDLEPICLVRAKPDGTTLVSSAFAHLHSPCPTTSTMNNTIEPHLIALLNNDLYESYTNCPSLELPPLQDPNILKASGRPLLLEPNGEPSAKSQLAPKHNHSSVDEQENSYQGSKTKQIYGEGTSNRALGGSSPQSLRKILDDDTEPSLGGSLKKRHITDINKEDFVQLPQPPKKQKTAKQVVPPIIIGLYEPPLQAAVFPPIASSAFHDSHGRNSLNTVPPKAKVAEVSAEIEISLHSEPVEASDIRIKNVKAVRARNKWTEDETNALLLGVQKHGVGSWKDILMDTTYAFNNRSAVDLKDRFRVCGPDALRKKSGSGKSSSQESQIKMISANSKSSLMSENILITEDEPRTRATPENSNARKTTKSKAHRKKLEDLTHLGIDEPFRESLRRERRVFTEEEDQAILAGYKVYGVAWARMQRDPQFNLQSRLPTDLRDRFRTKFASKLPTESKKSKDKPSMIQQASDPRVGGQPVKDNISNGTSLPPTFQWQSQETDGRPSETVPREAPTSTFERPSLHSLPSREGLRIQEIISSEEDLSRSLPLQPQTNIYSFKDNFNAFVDQQSLDPSETLPFTQSYDWNSGIAAPFSNNIGEMDISRLLLDEPWPEIPNSIGKEKQSFTDINSIISSSAEPMHNIPSFMNMLNDPDPMDGLNDPTF